MKGGKHMQKNDVPEFECSVLPFSVSPEDKDKPPIPAMEYLAYFEIMRQLIDFLTIALRGNPKDTSKPLRIMVQAEKVMNEYTKEGFVLLLPEQKALQETIFASMRISRRFLIKRALQSPPETWKRELEWLDDGSVEVREDFEAACRHLDEGRRLFEGLRERSKGTSSGPPVAETKSIF
jgi:hypothetical protein